MYHHTDLQERTRKLEAEKQIRPAQLAERNAQGAMQQLQQPLKLVSELQKLTRQLEAQVQMLTAQLAAMQQLHTQKLVSEVQILKAQLAETNALGAKQQLQTLLACLSSF